ncbi:MAG: sporulation protein YtfJ [Clostridia bacterium]|nr:sporulation protein YtfJ [Clostridia bacterium]
MENKISDMIRTSLENVKDIVDTNTVIGEAVPTSNGTVIIPVSKVSVGIATGGLDYKGKVKEQGKPANFGGAGGTGISVKPVAFLVVKANGDVALLNVDHPTETGSDDTIDMIVSLIKKSPDIINKIKSLFKDEESAENSAE